MQFKDLLSESYKAISLDDYNNLDLFDFNKLKLGLSIHMDKYQWFRFKGNSITPTGYHNVNDSIKLLNDKLKDYVDKSDSIYIGFRVWTRDEKEMNKDIKKYMSRVEDVSNAIGFKFKKMYRYNSNNEMVIEIIRK